MRGRGSGSIDILEVRLDPVRIVDVRVGADAPGLLELAEHARALDVLEVHDGVLREVHDRAEVVVQALRGLGVLEDLDELLRPELLVVLFGHLDAYLHVQGPAVHHVLEEGDALLPIQLPEVREEPGAKTDDGAGVAEGLA